MRIVLVSGAWNDDRNWFLLEEELKKRSHTVEYVHFPKTNVTYAHYFNAAKEVIEKQTTPCVVVCHSMSGMVIGPLSDQLAKKIRHVFFISAYMPRNGESMIDQVKRYQNPLAKTAFKLSEDQSCLHVIQQLAQDFFYNCSSSEIKKKAIQNTHSQARAPLLEKVYWDPDPQFISKRTYIACTKDKMIPFANQLEIAKEIVGKIEIIDGDHFPQLSQPKRLADIITSNRYIQIPSKL